jgi:outer membrane receptor for ferrienterochelin and colicin
MLRRFPLVPALAFTLAFVCAEATAQIQQVEVKGPGAQQLRRDDVLGRIVVGREELARFGDTSLSGALKRQPGLSIGANGELRLRGLGAGYTQILIDGEPAPSGFAIDTLSPDLVERIEIQRSAQADASAQAVAGSINIILRKSTGPTRRSLKLGAERKAAATSPAATLQWTERGSAASYGLNATLNDTRRPEQPAIIERTSGADGTALRRFAEQDENRTRKLSLAPRADLKLDGGDSLAWQGLADLSRFDSRTRQLETTLEGAPTAYPDATGHALYDSWLLKSDLSWTHRFDASRARLLLKAGVEANGRKGDYLFTGSDAGGIPAFARAVTSGAMERRASSTGKYTAPLAAGHDIGIGWDAAATRRAETRLQHDSRPGSDPFSTLDQDYAATVGRLALFAQDEWAASERLQTYLGLRWEGLDTRTSGRDFSGAATASRVWSPVAQMVWKLPDSPGQQKRQLRLALARTYKAPQPRDLVPRRYTVNNDNGPASPDYQGNPLLRPELAWGLDAAYESYFARDAMLSVSAYARRVRDVMLLRLWEENGTWVSEQANGGRASVQGIEIDARLPLRPAAGPETELRANLGRNWSRLDAIPGPDNRLAAQAPFTLNLGADVRMGKAFSSGVNLHLTGGYRARNAAALTEVNGVLRELEAYAAWQAGRGQWRLTLSDLLHRDRRDGRIYDDGASASARLSTTPQHSGLRLQYETPI